MSKIAVITGASAGIGRATAIAFARDGWDVALIARGEDGLDSAADEVRSTGRRALVLPLDVADAAALEQAAQTVEDQLGPIDVWVNDAMELVFAPVDEITPDEFRRVTEVNYLGFVNGTLAALKRMKTRDPGVIIQVGSALAYRSIPLQSAYCATSTRSSGFTDSLRCELIHDRSNVRVTVVHMPAVNTPQFGFVRSRLPNKAQPVPPIFEPEVAARAILHSAKHPRRELFVGGPRSSPYGARRSRRTSPTGIWAGPGMPRSRLPSPGHGQKTTLMRRSTTIGITERMAASSAERTPSPRCSSSRSSRTGRRRDPRPDGDDVGCACAPTPRSGLSSSRAFRGSGWRGSRGSRFLWGLMPMPTHESECASARCWRAPSPETGLN